MPSNQHDRQRCLEFALIVIGIGLACLLHIVSGYKMVVLNLFYLPIVLAAFFLGRYRAGVLALFSVIAATVVAALSLGDFAAHTSATMIALALTVWAAVLGLNAILVGTLSDERAEKLAELHEAYVGVVEVLSRYLSNADPSMKDRAQRISELSQKVAIRMKLTADEVDDIRVAALLQDVENVEVTARVIRKAMGNLRGQGEAAHPFHGSALVQSLGSVLTGALPLILMDRNNLLDPTALDDDLSTVDRSPLGARIIRTVRRYAALLHDPDIAGPRHALQTLHTVLDDEHHPAVVHALEDVVLSAGAMADSLGELEPVAAG